MTIEEHNEEMREEIREILEKYGIKNEDLVSELLCMIGKELDDAG